MRPVAPPDWVRAADLGSVIVIVNYLTGGHCTLSGQACDLWRALATTGDADTAALAIDIVDQMMCRGLLTEVPTAQPWPPSPVTFSTASWGTVERYGRPAGDEQALFALNGVRYAARLFPARIACLEESVAAMLSLTLAGYRACWCHGVAADPLRLHAWVEADGKRVGEPASTGLFTPIMRVPSGGDDAARRPM